MLTGVEGSMARRTSQFRRWAAAALVLASLAVTGCTVDSPQPSPSATLTSSSPPGFHYELVDDLCEYVSLDAFTGSLPYVINSMFPDPVPLPGRGCTGDLDPSDGRDAWALVMFQFLVFYTTAEAEEEFHVLRDEARSEPLFADIDGIGQAATHSLGYLGGRLTITVLDGNAVIIGKFIANGALPAGTAVALTTTVQDTMANLQDIDPPTLPTPVPSTSALPTGYVLPDNLCDHVSPDALTEVLPIVAVELEKSDSLVASARTCIGRVGFDETFYHGGTFGFTIETFDDAAEAEARFEFQRDATDHQTLNIGQRAYQYTGYDLFPVAGVVRVLDKNAVLTSWWYDAQARDPSDEVYAALAAAVQTTMASLPQT